MIDILSLDVGVYGVNISENLFSELKFGFLSEMMRENLIKISLTWNPQIIVQRQAIFRYLAETPDFAEFIESISEKIENIIQFKSNNKKYMLRDNGNNERAFTEFRELLLFTECIDEISVGAKKFGASICGGRFEELFCRIDGIVQSMWYKNAKLYISRISEELRNIKSLSLGVNLNAQLGVKEFGIISLNSEYYTTNSIFDKLFGQRGAKDYICITPVSGDAISYSGYSLDVLNQGLYRAISDAVGASLRKSRKVIYNALCDGTAFLLLLYNEFKFMTLAYKYIASMKGYGLPLCFPEVSCEYIIEGLYNPNFVGNIKSEKIVKNDMVFDENGSIFILTGANSGGKTAFLRSVGIAQILFQMGLPIPSYKAKMPLFKNVFSHFSSNTKDINGGRFENECKDVIKFYEQADENSLVLLDELFSTTSTTDGCVVSARILKRFAERGCKCIYTTHMHALIYAIDEINSLENVKSRIDSLWAEFHGGACTYRILRKRESQGSFAESICEKYGFI